MATAAGSDLSAPDPRPNPDPRRVTRLRAAGLVLGVVAVGLCVVTLVTEWSSVSAAVAAADPLPLAAAAGCGLAGTTWIALQWQWVLAALGSDPGRGRVLTWFFAGELGKYVPGGVWAVVGRGELAHRGGVPRTAAYPATLLSLGLFCLSGAVGWAAVRPFTDPAAVGLARWWTWALIPVLLAALHPAVLRPAFGAVARISRGRLAVPVLPWSRSLGLLASTLPAWLLLGATNALVAHALGFTADPAAVAAAAVAAWVLGVLVPVPAGAGVREVAFAVGSGLPTGPAVLVAALARVVFVAVDLATGLAALAVLRRTSTRARAPRARAPRVRAPRVRAPRT